MKNRIVKQLLGISVATVLFAQMPMLSFAGQYDIGNGDITITATADDVHTVTYYESADGEQKTATGDTDPVVTGYTTENTVTINAEGGDAYVTLKDININMLDINPDAAVEVVGVNDQNDVHIELNGSNILKGGYECAGLQDELAGELIITDVDNNGSLTATGGDHAAAIGGVINAAGTDITISGGTVTATGGSKAAAIGGGSNGEGSYITIEGNATVTATGGLSAAAIGGGENGAGNNIKISGGEVTATGGYDAAAIGGGRTGAGTNIKISGGEVTATGGLYAAAIGGGREGDGTNIKISGGEVTATGASNAAAIGGGINAAGTDITISGGTVIATGGTNASAIGGGINRAGTNITISGNAKVTATGGNSAAAIGGGDEGAGTNITISGNAKVTATGGELAAAIGGGHNGAGTNITISGGEVNATGGEWGSGIGSGCEGTASGITISGGTVTAVGRKYFPGIGGMQCTDDVIISGSATVNAAGGAGDIHYGAGAAIGTASDGSQDGVIVNGTEKLNSADLYNTGSINIYPAGTTIAQISTTQPTTTYIGTIDPNAVIPPNPSGQNDKVITNDNNNNAGDPNNNVTSDTAPVDEAHAFVASTDAKLQEHINKILALINSGKIAEANALIANGILLDTGRWYTFNKDTCALIEKASQLGIKVTLHYEYDHTKYSTTIPAKTMISPVSLCNANGFVGFMNFYKYYGGFVRSN